MEQDKKRILFVANSGPLHINKFHLPYLQRLIRLGHEVEVACSDTDQIPIFCKKHEIPFGLGINMKRVIKSYLLMKEISVNSKYDIIYTHTAAPSAIVRTIFGKKRFSDTKIVYMAHGFHFSRQSNIVQWILYYPVEKILSYKTDSLIVINKEDYDLAIQKFKSKSVHLVKGVGIDNIFTDPELTSLGDLELKKQLSAANEFKLFYAGDLNKNKNQILLIKLMILLRKKHKNIKLYLAGEGKSRELIEKEIENNNLTDSVYLLGQISREEVKIYLEEVDLVVASSLREGLPINILEAFAVGIPVVATNVRGHNDLVIHGLNGYLTSTNPNDFFFYVNKIITNPELYATMSKKAKITSSAFYLDNVIAEIIDIILE